MLVQEEENFCSVWTVAAWLSSCAALVGMTPPQKRRIITDAKAKYFGIMTLILKKNTHREGSF
jgi:hypothetical protein